MNPGEMSLSDRVVIVTGASSGIGAATARALHAVGAKPVLAARRGDRLADLSQELGEALSVETDVTDEAQIQALIWATMERHGRVDGLVNNAGSSLHEGLGVVDLSRFREGLELNVIAPLAVMQAVLVPMRAARFGRIVNVSSGTTRTARPGVGPYAATKSALNMLSAVARAELAPDGVAVSLLLPSVTATEFGGGRYRRSAPGAGKPPVQSPEYVAKFIVRLLRSGEECVDIPHGDERSDISAVPTGSMLSG